MNEPQLSAEMERRFDEEFGFLASPIDGVVAGNYPLIKHFLATALEEQATRHTMLMAGLEAQIEQKAVIRASELVDKARKDEREKILSEMEEWAESKKIVNTTGGFGHHMHNALLIELRAKLNQLKEG